eukprot:SAG31_NODE_2333_length_5929_cov_3.477702_1_plen_218_part_00
MATHGRSGGVNHQLAAYGTVVITHCNHVSGRGHPAGEAVAIFLLWRALWKVAVRGLADQKITFRWAGDRFAAPRERTNPTATVGDLGAAAHAESVATVVRRGQVQRRSHQELAANAAKVFAQGCEHRHQWHAVFRQHSVTVCGVFQSDRHIAVVVVMRLVRSCIGGGGACWLQLDVAQHLTGQVFRTLLLPLPRTAPPAPFNSLILCCPTIYQKYEI